PRDALPLPGRADAAVGGRALPHPAREQQRLLPGQRALLAPLGPRRRVCVAARVHAAADPPPPGASGVPPQHVPRGSRREQRATRRLLVSAGRPADDAARLGHGRAAARRVPERRGARHAHAARRAGRGRLVPDPLQRTPRGRGLHAAAAALRPALDARALDVGPADGGAALRAGRGHARVACPLRLPARVIATYRLQLTPDFGFAAARALVPYLRELGVSHVYLSPVLQARRGSTHG